MVLIQETKQRLKSAFPENIISAFRRVAGNVTKSPNPCEKVRLYPPFLWDHLRLLSHVENTGRKESDKVRYSACTDNYLSVLRSSRSDVFQIISSEQSVFLPMQSHWSKPKQLQIGALS